MRACTHVFWAYLFLKICKQFKKPGGDPDVWSAEEHMINRLYYPQFFTPAELFDKYEGVLTMRLMPNVQVCFH